MTFHVKDRRKSSEKGPNVYSFDLLPRVFSIAPLDSWEIQVVKSFFGACWCHRQFMSVMFVEEHKKRHYYYYAITMAKHQHRPDSSWRESDLSGTEVDPGERKEKQYFTYTMTSNQSSGSEASSVIRRLFFQPGHVNTITPGIPGIFYFFFFSSAFLTTIQTSRNT